MSVEFREISGEFSIKSLLNSSYFNVSAGKNDTMDQVKNAFFPNRPIVLNALILKIFVPRGILGIGISKSIYGAIISPLVSGILTKFSGFIGEGHNGDINLDWLKLIVSKVELYEEFR